MLRKESAKFRPCDQKPVGVSKNIIQYIFKLVHLAKEKTTQTKLIQREKVTTFSLTPICFIMEVD